MGAAQEAMARAERLEPPILNNKTAENFLREAIYAEKKWALAQQSRIAAISVVNIEIAKGFGSQADNLAGEIAINLMMAHKSLGIVPE
jgi:hypothetical protein